MPAIPSFARSVSASRCRPTGPTGSASPASAWRSSAATCALDEGSEHRPRVRLQLGQLPGHRVRAPRQHAQLWLQRTHHAVRLRRHTYHANEANTPRGHRCCRCCTGGHGLQRGQAHEREQQPQQSRRRAVRRAVHERGAKRRRTLGGRCRRHAVRVPLAASRRGAVPRRRRIRATQGIVDVGALQLVIQQRAGGPRDRHDGADLPRTMRRRGVRRRCCSHGSSEC